MSTNPLPKAAPNQANAVAAFFYNPIRPVSGPDPYIKYYQGSYYMTYTYDFDAGNTSIRMRKASSIAELANAPDITLWTDATSSRYRDFWAPTLFLANNRWYLYYTASDGTESNRRLHVLESSGLDPMGPYTYKAQLATNGWAIDGTVFQHSSGRLYFLWAGPTNPNENVSIAAMSNPWTLSSPGTIIASPTLSWENGIVEAPEVLERNGRVFVVYSGGWTSSPNYALGLLTATSSADLLNPASWTKSPSSIFSTATGNNAYSPGSASFFLSPDGMEDWMVYHATTSPRNDYNDRSTRTQRIFWNGDGTPNLGAPLALGNAVSLPAGDPGGVNNFLNNPSFEEGGSAVQWNTWPGNQGVDDNASYVEPSGYTGANRLTHYKASPYQVYTSQTVAVPNGLYTAKAWVMSGGGQQEAFLSVKNYGSGAELTRSIKDVAAGYPNWRELTIADVNVTSGSVTVGVYSLANAGNWLSVDNIRLYRQ